MYKIANITDRECNVKRDFIDEMKTVHPNLSGDILYPELTKVGGHFCFVWNDDSGKMLRTSTIEEYENNENTVKIVTMNSIYTLEKVEE